MGKSMTPEEAIALYLKAHEAGQTAGRTVVPTPMVVGSPTTLGNDIDYNQKTYFVSGGPCGFGWVHVGGRESFVRALKKALRKDAWSGSGYEGTYGGVRVRMSDDYPTGKTLAWCGYEPATQSVARNAAYAAAFSEVLRQNGVASAYSQSRLD